jgi:hypothetical protein
MLLPVDPTLSRWENYYVIVGSAAAALIGIQFVVITLIGSLQQRTSAESIRAFGTPTVVHLSKRMTAKLRDINSELRRRMHEPIPLIGEWLKKVLIGYYQYHAIPGNLDRMSLFRHRLRRLWAYAIRRRSQRSRMNWQRLTPLLDRWTPPPRVLHLYPMERFAARYPR